MHYNPEEKPIRDKNKTSEIEILLKKGKDKKRKNSRRNKRSKRWTIDDLLELNSAEREDKNEQSYSQNEEKQEQNR